MKWTSLMVAVLAILSASIVVMFTATSDAGQRETLIEIFKELVLFFVAGGAVAAGGYTLGFVRGKGGMSFD